MRRSREGVRATDAMAPTVGGAWARSVDGTFPSPAGHPDPRLVQSALAALVAVDLTARAASGAHVLGAPLLGAALVAALTVTAWATPWARVAPWWSAALVAGDLLAIGLCRLDGTASGPVALAALPAYFLGRQFGRAGVVGALLGVVALVAVPQLLVVGVDAPQNARLLTTSLIVVACAQIAASTVARLRREQEVTVAIVGSVPVGVVLVDASGRYSVMNPTQAAIMSLAFPTGDTTGDALIYAADGVTRLAREEFPSARAAAGEDLDGVVVWVGADPATRRALSVNARVVRDARGEFAGASLACHDITGFLHATRVQDEFVATVSHELRTPLTSVLGHLEIALERDDLAEDLRGQLVVSLRNAERLDGLVDHLLDAALSRDDRATLSLSTTDVTGLVEQAVTAVGAVAAARGVRLETDTPPRLIARVDAVRMGQALGHLLSNAVKYADGLVTVRARAAPAELVLEVSDDGPGVAPAERDLVFTRFYRSERSRQNAVPGIGLGLALVRDAATAHGGRVEVLSPSGSGATFVIRVPA